MRRALWLVLALAGFCVPALAFGATVRELEVSREGEAYRVRFEAVVDVPPDRVFALLTDYDRLVRLHPGITEAERLPPRRSGEVRVRTVLEACVAVICRSLERVERVRSREQRLIEARIVAGASDFRSGSSRWELAAVSRGTRIRFRSRMVPDVWVPPVIGPWAIEQALRGNLRTLVRRLEGMGATR